MFNLKRQTNTEFDPLPGILEAALGESPREAKSLGTGWHKARKLITEIWHESATESLSNSLERANRILMEDEELLKNFLRSSHQGTVLMTIHMGDYLHALFRILTLTSGREVVILRRKSWSNAEQTMFGKINLIGHKLITVRHGPGAARKIIGALRGGAIVVLLYDLSRRWGETAPVKLFNSELYWVSGPLFMSILGRSFVIPFFTFEQAGHWICELNPVRDYSYITKKVTKNRAAFLNAEMQKMAALAESYIRANVTQWNHWHLLPEMAQKDLEADCA